MSHNQKIKHTIAVNMNKARFMPNNPRNRPFFDQSD